MISLVYKYARHSRRGLGRTVTSPQLSPPLIWMTLELPISSITLNSSGLVRRVVAVGQLAYRINITWICLLRNRGYSANTRRCKSSSIRCHSCTFCIFLFILSWYVYTTHTITRVKYLNVSVYSEHYLQTPVQLEHACSLLLQCDLFTFHSERMRERLLDDAQKVFSVSISALLRVLLNLDR